MRQKITSSIIALMLFAIIPFANATSWDSDNSFRILAEFDTGAVPINNDPARLEVYFHGILQDMGVGGEVDIDSVRIVEYDKATGTPKIYNPAETGNKRSEIPHRVFYSSHAHTPVATHHLSWTRANDSSTLFAIYFDPLDTTPKDEPDTFPMIGGGEPIIASSGALDVAGINVKHTIGDMDGDLVEDIVAGGFNEIGTVQVSYNLNTRANPIWSNWKRFKTTDGQFINSQIFHAWSPEGMADPKIYDFDFDGDLDLYIDFNQWYMSSTSYYENTGGWYMPRFEQASIPYSPPADTKGAWSGRADWGTGMKTITGYIRTLYLEASPLPFEVPGDITQVCAYDWDNDFDKDILVATQGGTFFLLRNSGTANFSAPEVVLGQNVNLSSGSFGAPWAADWDGDGDLDLFNGNEEGQIIYFENIGSRFKPNFVRSGFVEVGGTKIDYPGENWNPTELTWGYAMPTIIDWDGDGDLDLIGSERLGFHNYYENTGDSTNPVLAAPVRLKYSFNGSPIETDKRVRPAIYDWDNDGDMDLIMTHTNGYASIYKNTNAPDKITFLLPQSLFQIEPYNTAGRTKYTPIDWDGDGDKDLITSDHIFHSWPRYYENTGGISSPSFVRRDEPIVKGTHLWVSASHEMTICPVDWDDDGREDILIGGEDGYVYYYNRKMFDPQPALKSAVIKNNLTGDMITSHLDDYFDLDVTAQVTEVFADDFDQTVPPPPGNGWTWAPTSGAFLMHNDDYFVIWGASGTEQVTYSPGLTGVYDIYVMISEVAASTDLKIRLSGESSWYTVSQPGTDSGGDGGFYQEFWKQADLTGKNIEMVPQAGTTVYLDFLKFVPVKETSFPIYDISYNPGTVTLKCRHLSGKTYNIYYADGMPAGIPGWQLADGNVPASGSGYLEWTDSGDTGSGRLAPDDPSVKQRFYLILETE